MAQLFVYGIDCSVHDGTILSAVRRAADAVGESRDPVVKWTRGIDAKGGVAPYGFLELSSIATSGALFKACEKPEVGMKVLPDTLVSQQCMAAANVFEANALALASEDGEVVDNLSKGKNSRDSLEKKSLIERLRAEIKDDLMKKLTARSEKTEDNKEKAFEEKIKSIIRLEPRPPDISDALWEELKSFRRNQAIAEIKSDERRKRVLERLLEKRRRENREEVEPLSDEHNNHNRRDDLEDEGSQSTIAPSDPMVQGSKDSDVVGIVLKKKSKTKAADFSALGGQEFDSAEATEAGKKRRLVPIVFTDEEKKAGMTVDQRLKELSDRATKARIEEQAVKVISDHVEQNFGEADATVVDLLVNAMKDNFLTVSSGLVAEKIRPLLADDADSFAADLVDSLRKTLSSN